MVKSISNDRFLAISFSAFTYKGKSEVDRSELGTFKCMQFEIENSNYPMPRTTPT